MWTMYHINMVVDVTLFCPQFPVKGKPIDSSATFRIFPNLHSTTTITKYYFILFIF